MIGSLVIIWKSVSYQKLNFTAVPRICENWTKAVISAHIIRNACINRIRFKKSLLYSQTIHFITGAMAYMRRTPQELKEY